MTTMSEKLDQLLPALLEVQKNMESAKKDAKNPFFKSKYADLPSVIDAAMPLLSANGVVVLQPNVHHDGKSFVRTMLLHVSGQFISGETEVICSKQNDPQAQGSAITYARRYGLQSLICQKAEDDDGEGAMNRPAKTLAPSFEAPKAQIVVTPKTSDSPVAVKPEVSTVTTEAPVIKGRFKAPAKKVEAVVDAKKDSIMSFSTKESADDEMFN